MENDPEVAAAIARIDAVIAGGWQPKQRSAAKDITGMTRWVRKAWPHIEGARQKGFTWQEICEMMDEAGITLNDGRKWAPKSLSATVARERQRRPVESANLVPPFQASLALLDIAVKGIAGDDGELQRALIDLAERCEALDMRQIRDKRR